MGNKYKIWNLRNNSIPASFDDLRNLLYCNRSFTPVDRLFYGDHGIEQVVSVVTDAIQKNEKIALYADYDVDGTMSCVSWIWFFRAIGFKNFVHYIPCRFKEGYGVNLKAIQNLVEVEKARLVITMDTGITANEEAAYCKSCDVTFICTDHHLIQKEKMPDCIVLNPKLHPDSLYRELCGCGMTFVLLRKLSENFSVPHELWTDILAITGMATICDVVPLNGVNHKLAKMGIEALGKSRRLVLKKLIQASMIEWGADEKDVGFRLGPRINAVGRLDHADSVIKAFIEDEPETLIKYMSDCNDRRKVIQTKIVKEAEKEAEKFKDDPIIFLGGDWHPGVVGIAAGKLSEKFWKPVWLFNKNDEFCKGSARSIPGFNVTEAMSSAGNLFLKYGGHESAGGFSFDQKNEQEIRYQLIQYATKIKDTRSEIWESSVSFDCELPSGLLSLDLVTCLDDLKPFGHGFGEPVFKLGGEIENVTFYNDKKTGEPKHTAIFIKDKNYFISQKIMFFNEVVKDFERGNVADFLVSVSKNIFRGDVTLSLSGIDFALLR